MYFPEDIPPGLLLLFTELSNEPSLFKRIIDAHLRSGVFGGQLSMRRLCIS